MEIENTSCSHFRLSHSYRHTGRGGNLLITLRLSTSAHMSSVVHAHLSFRLKSDMLLNVNSVALYQLCTFVLFIHLV